MKPEELPEFVEILAKFVEGFAAEASGRILALMHVVRTMQAQPSFDHDAFLARLAALDAALEDMDNPSASMTPTQKRAFDETVQTFLEKLEPHPESWILRAPKPRGSG
jgi:hypothetical protein